MNQLKMVKIAKALADPTRLRILRAIQEKCELNCSQICEKFPLSQPTISHHIKTLEDAGLITVRKKAQYHILAANCELLGEFARGLAGPGPQAPARPPASKKNEPRRRPSRAPARGR
ncbi:MAG TPA: metalloregulator ArsR/SmtB family transcription factor [Phycisphaerales bacterium]|nr:metalloregulator ArsR/SmtB family transcription factor [Phycisphaerales bacterium]